MYKYFTVEFSIECIIDIVLKYKIIVPLGKNTVKGATQVSGHSLKLRFYVFERSQAKHNNLDYHNVFGIFFNNCKIYMLKVCMFKTFKL
jgi:hypothetical protein